MSLSDIKKTPVVLLVEDEWLVRMGVADALTEAGLQVVEIGSGEAALAYLREGNPIDLLLTDIRLTGPVNGWEVADACRAIAPDLPVVYVSANPREDRRMVSGSEFLSKPSRTEMLIATCRRLLGGETVPQ